MARWGETSVFPFAILTVLCHSPSKDMKITLLCKLSKALTHLTAAGVLPRSRVLTSLWPRLSNSLSLPTLFQLLSVLLPPSALLPISFPHSILLSTGSCPTRKRQFRGTWADQRATDFLDGLLQLPRLVYQMPGEWGWGGREGKDRTRPNQNDEQRHTEPQEPQQHPFRFPNWELPNY